MLNSPIGLYVAVTTIWMMLSIFAFLSSIWRLIIYRHLVQNHPAGAVAVFGFLTSYLNWSTANRLVTSLWFVGLGILILAFTKTADRFTAVSVGFIAGIVIINTMIVISNAGDYRRWQRTREKIIAQYARDVDFGIRDALLRLGIAVNKEGNLDTKTKPK